MAQVDPKEPESKPSPLGWTRWLADPRTAVLSFLGAALIFGGGRRLLQGIQARRAVNALGDPDVRPEEVEAVADHGREGIIELFRLLGPDPKPGPKTLGPAWTNLAENEVPPGAKATPPEIRDAAGRALAILWAKDDLIVEEEKALVRRGFAATWKARRRYPRALRVAIPIEVSYGVPFLIDGGRGVGPSSLEWSHRIQGYERAALADASPWTGGPGLARFEVEPIDFPTLGPHRLALAAKLRVVGLTDNWEIELPHLPFSFEFDPNLHVEALLTTEDGPRAEAFARSVRFESASAEAESPQYVPLNADFVLRDPPDVVVTPPLPCDLAHRIAIEIEDVPGRFPAGTVVLSSDGRESAIPRRFPLGRIEGVPADAIDRPSERRLRAILTVDPELGWADPDARSVWPGTITTDWVSVRAVRR